MSEKQSNITKEWELYMYLLRCAIRREKLEESKLIQYQDIPCEVMYNRAQSSGQSFLLSDVLEQYASFRGEEDIVKKKSLGQVVFEYEKYKCIRNVLSLAETQEIPLVVFKGCVLADLYPQYIQRSSCDTDFYIDKSYRQQAVEMLVKAGYVINEEHSKDEVCVLQYSSFPHTIELHTCLWEDYKGKRLDILDSFGLTDQNKLIELTVCGFKVTTLGYEEHLIYQLFHIIKHFSLEGIGVKYLADIALYVDAYGKYIDYKHLWDRLEQLDYARFAHCLFAICIEFLGMDGAILSDRHMVLGEELVELMMDLFNGGNIYDKQSDSWQILGMMTPYFTGEKKSGKSKLSRKLAVIFPRARDLQDNYDFARKHPVLLPVAWIKRIWEYLVKYHSRPNNWYSAGEKLNVAEHRIDLMDKLGLLG